ncbi:MAG: hypothetical protein OJF47_000526 [Nitrospira sp.]|nr:MAG: hypothetical protein OJF47_000526 [Nitrospira sp.]
MGPRHHCRGIGCGASQARPARQGFNGATASLPWNLNFQQIVIWNRHAASMGPRHHCRGIFIMVSGGQFDGRCFNGATASLPWNRKPIFLHPHRHWASMGPRHHCRGIASRYFCIHIDTGLQWGHGITAVESQLSCSDRLCEHASMGPRHHCRGIRLLSIFFRQPTLMLQWGHGITAVESYAIANDRVWPTALQWGHGITAVESLTIAPDKQTATISFNGATASLPWNQILASRLLVAARGRFNGATASLPWNHRKIVETETYRRASMGPRHHCRGISKRGWSDGDHPDASMGPRHHCRGISRHGGKANR